MSAALTSRSTGGAYFTPLLIFTVIVLLSAEIFGLALGEVRDRVDRVVRLVRVKRPVHRIADQEAQRVIGLARVDVIDVAGGEKRQRASLLASLIPEPASVSAAPLFREALPHPATSAEMTATTAPTMIGDRRRVLSGGPRREPATVDLTAPVVRIGITPMLMATATTSLSGCYRNTTT